LNHVHDADAGPVGEGLDIDEATFVNMEVAIAPTFEAEVFFGFGGRPSRDGFTFQCRKAQAGLWLAF